MKLPFWYVVSFLLLTFSVQSIHAQDVLVLHDGDEIEAEIITVSSKNVEYKNYDNQSGPTFKLEKRKIYLIKYENGEKEFFNQKNQPNSKRLTIGLGVGYGNGRTLSTNEAGLTVSTLINFYYNINSRWSAGLEYQTIGGIDHIISHRSVKGKYFLGDSRQRVHVGLGIGIYKIDNLNYSEVGFSPEVGLNLGFFQIAANYHVLPSEKVEAMDSNGNISPDQVSIVPSVFEVKFTANINFLKP